jgi:phosphatidylglycerol:prolipoprotein diacylglycerol transferase
VAGEVLFLYLILYGAGRAFIEGLRTDSLYLGSFRISQLLSVLLLIAALVLFIYRRIKSRKAEDAEPAAIEQSQYGSLLMKMKDEEEAGNKEGKENKTETESKTESKEEAVKEK